MMVIRTRKQGESQMRMSLIAAAAAFGFIVHAAASAQPIAHQAQIEQSGAAQTNYQSAWVDHTRKAQPGDYNA